MSRSKALNLMDESVHPVKTIFWLAWPVMIEQLMSTFVQYVDAAMVGGLGAYATAAVSISNPIIMMINGIVMSCTIGLTAMVARSIGAKQFDYAKKLVRHGVLLILFLGLPLSIITALLSGQIPIWMGAEADVISHATTYNLILSIGRPFMVASMIFNSSLRGAGDTKTPMLINVLVNLINILGNFFLISETPTIKIAGLELAFKGAGLGVAGAAIASAASFATGGILAALVIFNRDSVIKISLRDDYSPDKSIIKNVLTISLPAMLERLCMSSASVIVSKCIASLGTVAVASNSLFLTAESLSYMPAFAFQSAATTLVGQSLGAERPQLARKFLRYITYVGIAVMIVMGFVLYTFATPLISFFTKDQAVIELASTCLRIVAFLQPFQCCAWVFAGALRGAGDTKTCFIYTIICNWGFRTLGSFVAVRILHYGLPSTVVFMFADGFVRSILFYLRVRGDKWLQVFKENRAQKQAS